MIFICIPIHNRIAYTIKCLQSVFAQNDIDLSVVVCDDGSTDNSEKLINGNFPNVKIIAGGGDLWWSGATNACVRWVLANAKNDDFIYTLNNDTELLPGALFRLLESAKKNPNSVIGTLNLFFEDNSKIENSAFVKKGLFKSLRRLHRFGATFDKQSHLIPVWGLAGKGVLIPVNVFREIGLYDEKSLPHYHADLEFTIRAKKAGFNIFLDTGAALLSHQELSGIGSVTSAPIISEFLKSFSSMRSTHHIPSLRNYLRLTHGRFYHPIYLRDLLFICLGFIKRYTFYHLHKLAK